MRLSSRQIDDSRQRLQQLGSALSSLREYPFYCEHNSTRAIGSNMLLKLTGELGSIAKDLNTFHVEIQEEGTSEHRVAYSSILLYLLLMEEIIIGEPETEHLDRPALIKLWNKARRQGEQCLLRP
jgi:hypothetical protein